jgi:hypothetical protein
MTSLSTPPEKKYYPAKMVSASPLLVISVGEWKTQVMLFDLVENRYRLLGQTSVITSTMHPTDDISISVRDAIKQLQKIVAHPLINKKGGLIQPLQEDGSGVDQVVATIAKGHPLKIIAAGLLREVSVTSAIHLARSVECGELDCIDLNQANNQASVIDQIHKTRPDIIIVAGGTKHGARGPVFHLFETVALACQLLPEAERPIVLFAGNQDLQEIIQAKFDDELEIHYTLNIRPTLDQEQLNNAQREISHIVSKIRCEQIPGMQEIEKWTNGHVVPKSYAMGNIIQFLSKARSHEKGVMGIEVSSSSTTIATAYKGNLALGVYPELGLGANLSHLLIGDTFLKFTRWLPFEIPSDVVQAYILNKHNHPTSIPYTPEELAIEGALTRYLMQTAILEARSAMPTKLPTNINSYLPLVEPVLAIGDVFTHPPTLAQSLLLLLDGLQPVGATTFVLDPYNTAAALGAAAEINPTLSIQVLNSNAFIHLGTVISPIGGAKEGAPILRATMVDEDGYELQAEVEQGSIEWLPLATGKSAQMHMYPLHKSDIGMGGPGIGGTLRVKGGAMGVVIDARGRPLTLPSNAEQRYLIFQEWLSALGG